MGAARSRSLNSSSCTVMDFLVCDAFYTLSKENFSVGAQKETAVENKLALFWNQPNVPWGSLENSGTSRHRKCF